MNRKRIIVAVALITVLLVGCTTEQGNLITPQEVIESSANSTSSLDENETLKESENMNKDNNLGANISPEYKTISPQDAYEQLAEAESIILLDVRTQEEWESKRIEGSILVPDYEVALKIEAVVPNKEAKIFVYCRSGRRSEGAAKTMVELGYVNVSDLGGIVDWPYETVSGVVS